MIDWCNLNQVKQVCHTMNVQYKLQGEKRCVVIKHHGRDNYNITHMVNAKKSGAKIVWCGVK